jgi:hypothetical protein
MASKRLLTPNFHGDPTGTHTDHTGSTLSTKRPNDGEGGRDATLALVAGLAPLHRGTRAVRQLGWTPGM